VHHKAMRARARPGFTLVELLVATVLGTAVMIGVLTMFIAENARLSTQRELSDTWLTLRTAAELLAYDLRHASATGGDLAALTDTAFTVRTRRGGGQICRKLWNYPIYAMTAVSGESAVVGDSVLVMPVQNNPVWKSLRVAATGTPAAMTVPVCGIPGTVPVAAMALNAGDTANVNVGSPYHVFRSTRYGIVNSQGRRWLGRRVNGATTWEILAGPLRMDGFQVTFYTSAGATTTTPSQVAAARITLRGESLGRTNTTRASMQDTMSVRIQLRN
jgi:type II secretory pathway pseudopilin PulG